MTSTSNLITEAAANAAVQSAAYAVGLFQLSVAVTVDGQLVRILFAGCPETTGDATQVHSLDNLARIAVIRAIRYMEKKA